ncbi:uncharacterized protein MYCFIDRAFT_84264 [Pseudocercospora fijiensis CIRAD86]|uniref:FAD-binding domain-containing protein n=1 Tax=Pseudocercospora fijiensis (strain CIRAD86) TaxID=383855 RepID=N1Q8F1_PSEFD|nr:uncharacterized protein MYCFIDRAFT_84264 [Pseudocercospora fijiensis CIRAD86]EME87138.1 hypothetical protein MYCFIDRAFT_84264 [Pseudocercospora fijiensis CIRAD86]
MTGRKIRVVIVGGGIGGLVAATFLAQHRHQVTVLERRQRYAESEFLEAAQGINLTKNVWTCFAALGMTSDFEQISDYGKDCTVRKHIDGSTARVVNSLNGHRFVHRTNLPTLLFHFATKAGAAVLQGESFTEINDSNEGVTLQLQSIKELAADLVIGCDGIHSKRYHLQMSDHTYGTGTAYNLDEADTEGAFVERYSNMHAFRKRWSDFEPAIRDLLGETAAVTKWRIAELPELPSWASESGKLVLLGDAAHAFPPWSGENSNVEAQQPSANEAIPSGAKGAWSTMERYKWIDEYDAVAEAHNCHFDAKL